MSIESVRAFFAENAPDISVIESDKSSATVALAAEAFGVTPAEIAKTLSLRVGERVLLVVTCGTLVGSLMPLLFQRMGLDPALMSNPFVSGIMDIVGITTYLNVAAWLLSTV